jgi:hypothetical protein
MNKNGALVEFVLCRPRSNMGEWKFCYFHSQNLCYMEIEWSGPRPSHLDLARTIAGSHWIWSWVGPAGRFRKDKYLLTFARNRITIPWTPIIRILNQFFQNLATFSNLGTALSIQSWHKEKDSSRGIRKMPAITYKISFLIQFSI